MNWTKVNQKQISGCPVEFVQIFSFGLHCKVGHLSTSWNGQQFGWQGLWNVAGSSGSAAQCCQFLRGDHCLDLVTQWSREQITGTACDIQQLWPYRRAADLNPVQHSEQKPVLWIHNLDTGTDKPSSATTDLQPTRPHIGWIIKSGRHSIQPVSFTLQRMTQSAADPQTYLLIGD